MSHAADDSELEVQISLRVQNQPGSDQLTEPGLMGQTGGSRVTGQVWLRRKGSFSCEVKEPNPERFRVL